MREIFKKIGKNCIKIMRKFSENFDEISGNIAKMENSGETFRKIRNNFHGTYDILDYVRKNFKEIGKNCMKIVRKFLKDFEEIFRKFDEILKTIIRLK